MEVVVSGQTNKQMEDLGAAAAIDEMCLSMKIYLGHVRTLIGKCDYILVPRIRDFGIRRTMCVTFEGLPDIVRNVFYDSGIHILSYDVDSSKKLNEQKAMVKMAQELGFHARTAEKAYKIASKTQKQYDADQAKKTELLYKAEGLKIVIAAHSYVYRDPYIGKPVVDYLRKERITVIFADQVDHGRARSASEKLSPTLKWELSREIAGSLYLHCDKMDGVILLSVYPCALDSMVNDMLIRKNEIAHIPLLQLTLDAQSGMAGLETRLESFLDIIRMREAANT